MELISEATTLWSGDLMNGRGAVSLDSSEAASMPVSWEAAPDAASTSATSSPEELLGAAHSACYAIMFAKALTDNNTPAETLHVSASVTFSFETFTITGSELLVDAKIPGISKADFDRLAAQTKATCPVSLALTGIPITLEANLA